MRGKVSAHNQEVHHTSEPEHGAGKTTADLTPLLLTETDSGRKMWSLQGGRRHDLLHPVLQGLPLALPLPCTHRSAQVSVT